MADLATTGPTSQAAPARLDPYSLRKDFPILATSNRFGKPLVYLDSAATSLKPLAVIEAVDGYNREIQLEIHRGIYEIAERANRSL